MKGQSADLHTVRVSILGIKNQLGCSPVFCPQPHACRMYNKKKRKRKKKKTEISSLVVQAKPLLKHSCSNRSGINERARNKAARFSEYWCAGESEGVVSTNNLVRPEVARATD